MYMGCPRLDTRPSYLTRPMHPCEWRWFSSISTTRCLMTHGFCKHFAMEPSAGTHKPCLLIQHQHNLLFLMLFPIKVPVKPMRELFGLMSRKPHYRA